MDALSRSQKRYDLPFKTSDSYYKSNIFVWAGATLLASAVVKNDPLVPKGAFQWGEVITSLA